MQIKGDMQMAEEKEKTVKIINKGQVVNSSSGPLGGIYCVTIIGAAVYFVQNADGFWNVIWALVKALVWPGFVVHRALELMNI
jgi:hypothetical protein